MQDKKIKLQALSLGAGIIFIELGLLAMVDFNIIAILFMLGMNLVAFSLVLENVMK